MLRTEVRQDRAGNWYFVAHRVWMKIPFRRELEVDGKPILVESSPLPGYGGSNLPQTRLVRPSADVLELVPSWTAWVAAVLIFALVGVLPPAWWISHVAKYGWSPGTFREVFQGIVLTVIPWGLAAGFTYAAIGLVTNRSRFDRESGRAARWFLFRKVWDVAIGDVAAVQCLHAGWTKGKGGWHHSFQVNLALRTGLNGRVEVCSEMDGERAKSTARKFGLALSEFLAVPLVDQIDETTTPEPRPGWWE